MFVNVIFEEIDETLSADFFENEHELDADFGEVHVVSDDSEPYEGDYAVTPMAEKQVMPTKGKYMTDDVVVNPIPQEYGLITYDHNRTITVS
jgi:hypothetical protein